MYVNQYATCAIKLSIQLFFINMDRESSRVFVKKNRVRLIATGRHRTPQDTIGLPMTVPDTPGQYQYTLNY